jgi:N-acetyl-gamma-glutamyl-phosphate reductase
MSIDGVVLGATGYVGGELLRLIHAHPEIKLAAAVSGSRAGQHIGGTFPHLASAYGETTFAGTGDWTDQIEAGGKLALFSAAPHGASATAIAEALEAVESKNSEVHIVDSSADFRYADGGDFESVYGTAHPKPELLPMFQCAVPEHSANHAARHIGHPGCFATAMLLAAVPLVNTGLVSGELFVSAITGSTGSGRSPQAGTHHPERHSNLYAYKPLQHRHIPEVENLVKDATGRTASVSFVPHSGPHARGIYATLQTTLNKDISTEQLRATFRDFYSDAQFVSVVEATPRLKDVVASNYAQIGVSARDNSVVVMCAIDNLVKGAAGGSMQWMNRLWSLPESSGLLAPAPAWT